MCNPFLGYIIANFDSRYAYINAGFSNGTIYQRHRTDNNVITNVKRADENASRPYNDVIPQKKYSAFFVAGQVFRVSRTATNKLHPRHHNNATRRYDTITAQQHPDWMRNRQFAHIDTTGCHIDTIEYQQESIDDEGDIVSRPRQSPINKTRKPNDGADMYLDRPEGQKPLFQSRSPTGPASVNPVSA